MKNTDYDPCHVLNSKRNPKIGIISYGLGNIGALANMLLEIAYEGEFVTDPRTLKEYDLLILGSPEKDGWINLLLGGGKDKFTENSACSVLRLTMKN